MSAHLNVWQENKEPKTPLSDPLMLNEEHLNFSYLHLCNNINSNIYSKV